LKTSYQYDTLNNLITVNQGVQTRSFAYNSLSRLKSANNPESGLINYKYDENGNLTSKTDARSITTTYIYDVLNRVKNRNYSDNTTPNVAYTYDNGTNAKGKLTKVTTAATATNQLAETKYNSFDILGRVLSHSQITDGNTYNSSYVYNLSGALIEETYPSGRVVKNTLDVDGDLAQVQSRKSNGTFQNYANAFTYTSAGAVSSMRFGNGKFENTTFNSRLQPIQIGLGGSATSQNLLKLNFEYGLADNNGNVKSQTITTPTVGNVAGFTAIQTYNYDSLNRLKDAKEMIGTVQQWKQTFIFDRYGNRTFDTANGNTTTLPNGCPVAVCNPTANPQDNKLVGTNYDSVGNTKIDANGQTFIYYAENKQVQVNNASGIVGKYWYNGDGQRVKKYVPSTQETTIFVYDASNKLVAEYSTITASQTEAKISYLTNDHLGSPRITTDGNGQVVSRRDFMPFGEEVQIVSNGSDSVRQKFTGYERDGETGLDYAQARMFGSGLGRFTSPDPYKIVAEVQHEKDEDKADAKLKKYLGKPQQWNQYVYAINNPLKYVDPTGEVIELTGTQAEQNKAKARIRALLGEDRWKLVNESGGACSEASPNGSTRLSIDAEALKAMSKIGDNQSNKDFSFVMGAILNSRDTVEFKIAKTYTNANGETKSVTGYELGGAGTLNTWESQTRNIQIFLAPDASGAAENAFTSGGGGNKFTGGPKLTFEDEEVLAHEFGHAYGGLMGQDVDGDFGRQTAINMENAVRERRSRPERRTRE
jgi:RHS repeat-associated protein